MGGPRGLSARFVTMAVVVAMAMVGSAFTNVTAAPEQSSPAPPTPLDCTDWRYGPDDEPAPGVIPAEFDRDNYERTSQRDPRPELSDSPQNLCGQKGPAVDLAWGVTKGRDDVLIAVLDSGIKWRNPGDMADLATQAHINLGEARPPCAEGDCNGDGIVNITDFGAVVDRNENGLADPEDLILDPAFSDGVDDDDNGYVDDISGWDLVYGDNNPLDTPDYGHGTGEAKDSTAAENGAGEVGGCPRCRFLPVRVGTSFIADGGRFAGGVVFALDSGADVVQEALGAISNPEQAQQAIDAAYRLGVPVVASMADEASKHPNLPASLERTMAVNSVTTKEEPAVNGETVGYLALNGCTNYGGHTFVTVPSGSCSSEATGHAAGMMGLLQSAARDAGIARYPGLPKGTTGNVLSAEEAMQIVRGTADDIDFATPNSVDPANNFGTSTGGLIDTVRYPTTPGWDAAFGYGRINAYEIVKAVRDEQIPPEAEITSPRWFDMAPTRGSLRVEGRVAAVRARSYDYRVEWAVGLQPPPHPSVDQWHVVKEQRGLRSPRRGKLATIDLRKVAAALPDGGAGVPVDPATGLPDEERFTVRVRVVVTAHGGPGDGLTGLAQKQVFVHDDPDLAQGHPRRIASAGTASPVFADLDGRSGDELIVATDDGSIHAFDRRGRDIKGWPVRTPAAAWWPSESATADDYRIKPVRGQLTAGAPVVTDLDGNGEPEVAVTDLEGNLWVWDVRGRPRAGFRGVLVDGVTRSPARVDPAFSTDDLTVQDTANRLQPAFVAAPAAADLDGDGTLELVAAAMDRHVYAWHADGSPVAGFPVLVVDPAKVATIEPGSHHVTFRPDSGVDEGGGMVAAPALADLDGDGHPEIVVGAQEEYEEPINIGDGADVLALLGGLGSSGNTRLYAISPDGTQAANPDTSPAHPHEQAYLPGWPAKLGMLSLATLPTIGGGVTAQPVIGDVNATNPGPEVVAASAVGPVYVLNAVGRSVFGSTGGRDLPAAWAGGLAGAGNGRFGPNRNSEDLVFSAVDFAGPTLGRISGGDTFDIAAPTAGLSRLLDVQASDLQLPNHDQLGAWRGSDGNALDGFPQVVSDMAFFVAPAIADVDADGRQEVVAGNGLYTLEARRSDGTAPPGWPKLTGGWLVGTPGFGDRDGNGRAEMAVVRRDGVLLVWKTPLPAAGLTEWPRYGADGANSGSRP